MGGAVTGATMQIFNEGLQDLFACPIEMDPTLSHLCVSASGQDRVGWGEFSYLHVSFSRVSDIMYCTVRFDLMENKPILVFVSFTVTTI